MTRYLLVAMVLFCSLPPARAFAQAKGDEGRELISITLYPDGGPEVEEAKSVPGSPGWNAAVLNPLPLAYGMFSAEYERVVGPSVTLFVAPSIKLFNLFLAEPTGFGVGARFGVRWFFSMIAPVGPWVEPELAADYFFPELAPAGGPRGLQLGLGAVVGYTFELPWRYLLSLGGGVQLLRAGSDGGFAVSIRPSPSLRLAYGFAF